MRLSGKHLVFSFVLGGIAGAFGGVVAVAPREETEGLDVFDPERLRSRGTGGGGYVTAEVPADSDATALADHLSRARFDRDWGRVEGVAQVLRSRRSPTRAAAPAQFQGGPAERSLVLMDHTYRREAFLLELQGRENRATALASSDAPVAERQERLTAIFRAPLTAPEDAQVRADAAYLLGLLHTPAARESLLRALGEPDAALSDLAAEALGRAGDPLATAALVKVLQDDLDPAQRARAARALAWTEEVAKAGVAADALARAAERDRDLTVRTHALASLARVDLEASPRAQEALIGIGEDPTEAVEARRACVAAIAAHRQVARSLPGDLIALLERLLGRTDGILQLEVIEALGQTGRPESLPLLRTARAASQGAREAAALDAAIAALEERTDSR